MLTARSYPIILEKDESGGYIATFGGCYGVAEGATKQAAIVNAQAMIDEIFIYAIKDNEVISSPDELAEGQPFARVPTNTYLKYLLHHEAFKQSKKRTQLAKDLGFAPMQIDRIFSGKNKSNLYQLDEMAQVLGKKIVVTLEDAA